MERYKSIYKEDVSHLNEGVVDKKVFDILKSLGVSLTEKDLKKVNTLFRKNDYDAGNMVDFLRRTTVRDGDKRSLGHYMAYVSMLRDKVPTKSNMGFSKYLMPIVQTFEKSNLTDEQISFIKSEIGKLINVW
jgi:hypothetical protein